MVDFGSEICHHQEVTPLLSRLKGRNRLVERNGNGSAQAHASASATRRSARARYVVTAAESAPCTCPEFCERDHENE
jgi:hypothetical protein